ncbi:MAG TPA: ankyrin repeat domain-containing protein [Polyangiales bacterium]|nr:ankyrin repeat domain-containing protein [Polyangiales bacterium]
MNSSAPEKYFDEPRQLEAARAIVSEDVVRLRAATRGLDIDEPGKTPITLLWFAIHERKFEMIKTLVEMGSKPDQQVVQGLGNPIHYALQNQDTRILRAILDGGFPVSHADKSGTTLLHEAAGALGATLDHVKLLVERGAKLDAQDAIGDTPLDFAIETRQPDRAKYLLERGAKLNTFTTRGATPAWTVQRVLDRLKPETDMHRRFAELRELMIERGAKFPPDSPEQVRAWMKSQGIRVAE